MVTTSLLKKIIITLLIALGYLYGAFGLGKSEAAELIRVALVQGQSTAEITCESEFEIQSGGSDTVLPKGKYFLHIVDDKLVMEAASENGKQVAFASALYIKPVAGKAIPKVNERAYKGFVRAVVRQDKLLLVNYVDMEDYVASVLPAKTMVVWPDEAIKAQAVAARTYGLYRRQQGQRSDFDVAATDKELPYLGTGARIEKAGITKLIASTRGQYLVDAKGLPIMAVTTSSSGGLTEAASGAWGRKVSYLQSVTDYDSDSPDYKWEHRATPALLEGQLAQRGYAVGKLNSVRLSPLDEPDDDRTATGRVRYVILSGSSGTAKITGEELADIIGLKSALFDVETGTPPPETLKVPIEDRYGFEVGSKDIDIKVKEEERPVWNKLLRSYHMLSGGKEEKLIFHGRGKGSGLGLSAWGARGMVVENEKITYAQILEHYYPGTRLVK